jgi:hypothetical protein
MRWVVTAIGASLGMMFGIIPFVQEFVLSPPPKSQVEAELKRDYLPLVLAWAAVYTGIGAVLGFLGGTYVWRKRKN